MQKELILGPPGTGKTSTLLDVVSQLLEQGVQPNRIAYVSFTRKAVQEARERAAERFNFSVDDFEHFRNLHSMAFRANGLHKSDVMNDTHWREVSDYLGIDMMPGNMLNGIGNNQMIGFHLSLARNLCRDYSDHFLQTAGSMSLKRYYYGSVVKGGSLADFIRAGNVLNRYKAENGLWDFHDMLEMGSQCLPLDVDFAIIDEAQDLSPLQWQFARQMFKNVQIAWIAGDDDQAIYSWAGADLHTFRHMEANRTVLGKSHRLPNLIWEFATQIAYQIRDRYEKEWTPNDDDGEFRLVNGLEDLPLNNDESWYLLTRTKSQQSNIMQWLRSHGYPYKQNGKVSIKPVHLALANAWTKLQRGESISVGKVLMIYQHLRENQLEPWAVEKLTATDHNTRVRLSTLQSSYGLKQTEGLWHDVLVIDENDSAYYSAVKDRYGMEGLTSEPKIELNTMHGVKGGEADNVFFSTNMGRKPHNFYKTGYTVDDESRIFYVAATRAKKRLFLNIANSCSFPALKT